MAQIGIIPWNHTFAFVGADSYQVAFAELDGDYEIDEVGIAPDAVAVTSATFSAAIAIVSGGAGTSGGGKGSFASQTEGARPTVGQIRQGLLQDSIDPTGKGLNTVKLLSSVGQNNTWRIAGKQPIAREAEVLVFIVINSTKANSGTIVAQINGHQIERTR